ncbi:MAG: gluconate 2-dehydrogenase subunit 3 family protein, partial [Thermoplasmata archaeon]
MGTEHAAALTPDERRTLRLVADTLVPDLAVSPDPDGFFQRAASDLGVDADVARIIDSYVSPTQREDFRRLLRTLESPFLNLLLAAVPRSFSSMAPAARERYLLGWARSRLPVKRRGFQAVKRLVLFLAYSKPLGDGRNPNWPIVGYDGPDPGSPVHTDQPQGLRVEPLRPASEPSLDADACVIGSGAGGSVIAAKLAAAGHRVIVLEAGPYRTAKDFSQQE